MADNEVTTNEDEIDIPDLAEGQQVWCITYQVREDGKVISVAKAGWAGFDTSGANIFSMALAGAVFDVADEFAATKDPDGKTTKERLMQQRTRPTRK